MFNDPELDAVKARYFEENARPSISTVMYLRDQEIKDAQERAKEEYEKAKKKRDDDEKRMKYDEEQARLKSTQQLKEALPYSDSLAQEICERISVGELLLIICEDAHLPSSRQVNRWLREHTEFAQLYQSAINDRLNVFEEAVILIADDMRHDFRTVIKNGQEKRIADPDMVARAKLRIDVRFRHLKAGRPQKWGDSTTLITKSADEFDTSNLSAEQLEAEIAAIEKKSRITRVA
jgi:hypothetical protein